MLDILSQALPCLCKWMWLSGQVHCRGEPHHSVKAICLLNSLKVQAAQHQAILLACGGEMINWTEQLMSFYFVTALDHKNVRARMGALRDFLLSSWGLWRAEIKFEPWWLWNVLLFPGIISQLLTLHVMNNLPWKALHWSSSHDNPYIALLEWNCVVKLWSELHLFPAFLTDLSWSYLWHLITWLTCCM